jgi:NAD(P)-dependent dehydrogenase (short-subunit alcohol dehydrogenase family)
VSFRGARGLIEIVAARSGERHGGGVAGGVVASGMDPAGKAALINGGARMGMAMAAALASRGCAVSLTFRSSRRAAEDAAAVAAGLGVQTAVVQADGRDPDDTRRAVEETVRQLGRLDILINMASTYIQTPLDRLDEAALREGIDSHARSAFLFSMSAAPHMKRAGAGRIVNFADWLPVSRRPRYTGYLPYYVGKAAVAALTEGLALELAPEILVNAVAPGPVLPPDGMTAEERDAVVKATPLRRWGGAEEMARVVMFLVETEFVTGECVRADGGRHLY